MPKCHMDVIPNFMLCQKIVLSDLSEWNPCELVLCASTGVNSMVYLMLHNVALNTAVVYLLF